MLGDFVALGYNFEIITRAFTKERARDKARSLGISAPLIVRIEVVEELCRNGKNKQM